MSDPAPPPPPPPTGLTPPPGYTAYESSPWSAVPLRRVGGLATAITILLGIVAIGYLIDTAMIGQRVDVAEDYLAGEIDDDTFTTDFFAASLGSTLAALAMIAVVVTSIIWLYRVVANHRALGRRTTWAPGWAIGGWFLPPVLYVIPLLVLRENWRASDPSVPPGSDDWRRGPESPLPWIWFLLYSIVPIALAIAGASIAVPNLGGDVDDLAENVVDTQGLTVAQSLVTVAGAVAWALVVRGLTARHRQLSGETAGR